MGRPAARDQRLAQLAVAQHHHGRAHLARQAAEHFDQPVGALFIVDAARHRSAAGHRPAGPACGDNQDRAARAEAFGIRAQRQQIDMVDAPFANWLRTGSFSA
jgi:hypothetical protein